MIGVANIQNNPQLPAAGSEIGGGSRGDYGYRSDGNKYNNGSQGSYGATYTNGDVIGVAWSSDAGTLTFYKNGVSQGTAFSSITQGEGKFAPASSNAESSNGDTYNFGQRPFAYTPPTGFKALNTLNLPQPTILKGGQYFNTITYTGTGSTRTQTGVGFQPDFTWVKRRDAAADHGLMDSVRGASQRLQSNLTAAEDAFGFTAFASDGFTFNGGIHNDSGWSFAAWNWKEGATQGFDIVTYTGNATAGRTVSHSLGVAPVFIVTKRRDSTSNWWVYSKALNDTGSTGWLYLNLTSSRQTTANAADDPYFKTAPTSSVFSIAGDGINVNTATYVSYLFSEVAGYSRFGSYTGNGSTDGPFVFCGFRPRFILFKKTSATDDWVIYDTARDEYNVASKNLYPNGSFAEDSNTTNRAADILSNGFKLRSSGTFLNGSGATFIFAAFAEHPFKNSLAR
jgi:hypothetical protein